MAKVKDLKPDLEFQEIKGAAKVRRILATAAARDALHLLDPKSGASDEQAKSAMVGLVSGIAAATGIPSGQVITTFVRFCRDHGWHARWPAVWRE